MVEIAINIYREIVLTCVPVAVVFALCNISVTMILKAAFGGKLWLKD